MKVVARMYKVITAQLGSCSTRPHIQDKYISHHWSHDKVERCNCRNMRIACSHGHGNASSCLSAHFLSFHCIMYSCLQFKMNPHFDITHSHPPSEQACFLIPLYSFFLFQPPPQPFAFVKNPMDASLIAFFRVLKTYRFLYRHLTSQFLFFFLKCYLLLLFPSLQEGFPDHRRREGRALKKREQDEEKGTLDEFFPFTEPRR